MEKNKKIKEGLSTLQALGIIILIFYSIGMSVIWYPIEMHLTKQVDTYKALADAREAEIDRLELVLRDDGYLRDELDTFCNERIGADATFSKIQNKKIYCKTKLIEIKLGEGE